ncbi:MAG: aminotransferase class III-fold pyridoxal phosphate-dependent enzyme [Candidatus Rokubacteria bacterium]|nr:aminotransferase class III-fold pyridoxal phosphate-dependent enzyme [Candidatus Rokubacteria bacterium]
MTLRSGKVSLARSQAYLERARQLIPGCSQTFSKAPSQFVQGVSPAFLQRGSGSHVWDVDGNEYVDYVSSLGAIILGHNDPDVSASVGRQIAEGTLFSLPHPLEVEVAALLTELVPCAEMVRFGKNGSDATAGAVRAARAYTGRELVVCCGYHGWQDWYIGTTTRNKGVPEAVRRLTLTFPYNDAEALERILAEERDGIACVVMEPIGVVDPKPGFLARVRELTHRAGAVLIFDEIVTGFRIALGGAQTYFGVTPDLACFGKAMGNGYPVAAVVGRRDLMEVFEEVFFSFTFGGDALALAATLATLEKMRSQAVIPHLWRQGKILQDGYNGLAAELGLSGFTQCLGLPPRTVVQFKDARGEDSLELRSLFQQEMVKRGVLFLAGFNLTFAHSDGDVSHTLEACRETLQVVARAVSADAVRDMLEGAPVQPVFRRA